MSASAVERRPMGALGRMGVVAGIHVAVFYLIASGLGIVPSPIPKSLVGEIIEDPVQPNDPPPPPPRPELLERPVQVERPIIEIPVNDDPPPLIVEERPPEIIEQRPPEVKALMVGVRPDPRHALTQPPYPQDMVREGNEGSVELEVYVLANGRVGEARVYKSTGYPSLDESAMAEARRNWRLLPATRDGVPYAEWHRLRVTFKLKNRTG